jgi:hypothetical protein
MNEIILAPCDAGYVQSCTGLCYSTITRQLIVNKMVITKQEITSIKKYLEFGKIV